MTKTLTEQWREGTLKEGFYYILFASRFGKDYIEIDMFIPDEKDFMYSSCEDVKEVLAPVPDYQTWKDFQQHFVDKLELEVKLKKAYEQLEQESIKVVGLQEQLKEANDIIKYYAEKHGKLKACDYLNKWGVK